MKLWNVILENELAMLIVLIGIVQAIKHLFIQRKKIAKDEWWIFLVCVVVGLLAGFAYQFAYFGTPPTLQGWFNTVMFGLGLGVVLPWIYKAAGDIMEKVGSSLAQQLKDKIGLKDQ